MKNSENSKKTRTNADRIRALPNEVLAEILRGCCRGFACYSCPLKRFCNEVLEQTETDDWLDWLESEEEESDE